ncbi:MAG: hypothetical protein AB7Y46_07205 [Armatimonadota bacterium]
MRFVSIALLVTIACCSAPEGRERVTEPPAAPGLEELSVRAVGEPVVVAQEQRIVTATQEGTLQEQTARLMRLQFEVTGLAGPRRRGITGTASVYRVESVDAPAFEWHVVYPVLGDQPQPTLMMDEEGLSSYFVATTASRLLVEPITRARDLDAALSAWNSGEWDPRSLTLVWSRVVEPHAWDELVREEPPVLDARIRHVPGPLVEALSRAEDGTWSIVLLSRYRDTRIMLIGKDDDWRSQQVE